MDEKNYKSRKEDYESREGKKSHNRINLKIGATMLGLTALFASCDTITEKRDNLRGIDPMERELKEQIRQEKKKAKYEKRLNDISYTLKVKIEQRKDWVEEYNKKLKECEADPDNLPLKERTLQICQRVGEYNREIKSLAEKELNITIKLDDIRAKPHSGLPTGDSYTRPDFFDYLLRENKLENNNTANYFDFTEESNGNTLNDCYEDNPQGCNEETLEDLVRN